MSKKAMLMGITISMLFALTAMAQPKNAADKPAKSEPVAAAATPTKSSEAEDKAAIQKIVDGFLKAYKEHDAKALAALFVECGEMIDERGDSVCGRQRIENLFKYVFETHPKAELEISVQSIRFLTPSLAVETGTSKAIYELGESSQHNNYAVIYIKQDGQWLMASARDYPDVAATGAEELKQLEWLIGDWADETPQGVTVTSYRWAPHHDFILSDFTVLVKGRDAMTGSQRIGWDPAAKKLHSWVFDSEGGFSEGVWTHNGNQWIIKQSGVTSDGLAASATNVMTRLTKDRTTWRSRDRVIGEALMPDSEEITVVRRLPKPQAITAPKSQLQGETK